MIIDWLLNLVDSWLVGAASLLPSIEFDQVPIGGGGGGGNWAGAIVEQMAGLQGWGIPVTTMIHILQLICTLEIAYGTVLLVVFVYNRVRGA